MTVLVGRFAVFAFAAAAATLCVVVADSSDKNRSPLRRQLQDPLDCVGHLCIQVICEESPYLPEGECCERCAPTPNCTVCDYGFTNGCNSCVCGENCDPEPCAKPPQDRPDCIQRPPLGTIDPPDDGTEDPIGEGPLGPIQSVTKDNMCEMCTKELHYWDPECSQTCFCYDGEPLCPDPTCDSSSKFCYANSQQLTPTLIDVVGLLGDQVTLLEQRLETLSVTLGGNEPAQGVRRAALEAVDEVKSALNAVQDQLDNPR